MQSIKKIATTSFKNWRFISNRTPILSQAEPQIEKIPIPPPSDTSIPASPKIEQLCSEITKLNLIEVSELSALLKKRLNLPDAPMVAAGTFAPAKQEDEEEAAPQKQKTSFTVKLMKFDDKQKVALIKEIKNLLEGMNLVQAKKFVESAPVVVKGDIAKDEAEKLKEALVKVGASIEIE
ncbi:uncharacterized protein [Onthophagus taurus]|uniref:uncharacterized protein n=1 Tax=Onthophagus taurus TaxID=166361 RepID=UPI0039BE488D